MVILKYAVFNKFYCEVIIFRRMELLDRLVWMFSDMWSRGAETHSSVPHFRYLWNCGLWM